MLKTMDGVVLAVNDAAAAAKTYESLFATEIARELHSEQLNADITSLACGTDLIRLAQPAGPGPVAEHLERSGEGLFAAVFSSTDPEEIAARLQEGNVAYTIEHGHVFIDPDRTHGLRLIVRPYEDRKQVGIISFIYEVTHLVDDWQSVRDFFIDIFGLDGQKFSPIKSEFYGYEGTLTLLDPPALLDRIEVVTPYDTEKAMGRFFVKRGEGAYMFYTECGDMPALGKRLDAAGARFAGDPNVEGQSLFVHPSSTHGVLIGVSATNAAWRWSGRPELAQT
jgi:catechol 2,3-dioxygenase-like lactoylglutathione lyase family enzyme